VFGLNAIANAFAHRNYRIYVCGNALSLTGLWIQRVATGWLTWELTHSGAWLGAMAFADLFPSILVSPFAGVIADRADRLRIMRISQCLSMLQSLVLAALTLAGLIDVALLLVLVTLNGLVAGFNQPARLALVSSLVPASALSTAIAVNSIVFNLARFVGPAVAGALIVWMGVGAAFVANAFTFAWFLGALALLRLDPATATGSARGKRSMLRDLREGLRYVTGHPGIGPLLAVLTSTGVGVRCVAELFPGFADRIFGLGAGGLAALTSSLGVGAVLGGMWLVSRGGVAELVRTALLASVLAVVTVFLFASVQQFWLAVLLAGLSGVFIASTGISVQTLVQTSVAAEVRGRVLSLYGLIQRASPALGALLVGGASEWFGLRLPLLVSCALCAAFWLAIWRRRHAIARALQEGG
jgi:MFS family permease